MVLQINASKLNDSYNSTSFFNVAGTLLLEGREKVKS